MKAGFWMKQMQDYVKNAAGVTYLQDESHVIHLDPDNDGDGRKIRLYGSPWTGLYGKPGKAFQVPRDQLAAKWEKIPPGVDILITHMPPLGVLDVNAGGIKAGCPHLYSTVINKVKPKIHVFGHIHESYGHKIEQNILFINAANKRPRSKEMNAPVVVDYQFNSSHVSIIKK